MDGRGHEMNRPVLVRGGSIVDPSQGLEAVGDLLILNGLVEAVKPGGGLSAPEGARAIDARGLIVSPGFVDLHCHLREPGFEEKETIATGTRAAARGGFTTVCCMPNTNPAIDTIDNVELILRTASAEGSVRVLPVAAVTRSRAGRELVDMAALAEAGAIAFSDDGDAVADAELMRQALAQSKRLGLPISDHCEDPTLVGGVMHEGSVSARLGLRGVSAASEDTMVARDIRLAELTGGHVHIAHLSTAGSVNLVRQARARGVRVTAEVTPHHLTLTDERVATPGGAGDTNTRVNPPLRSIEHVQALREGLRDGVIDAIATDHAPHTTADKLCAFDQAAPGISGIETALASVLSLVHGGILGMGAVIAALTWRPAAIVDLRGLGLGTLREQAPGDVTLIDPNLEWTVDADAFASKGKNTPLAGQRLKGRVIATLFGGGIAYEESAIGETHGR
jgi:dihydroorotase